MGRDAPRIIPALYPFVKEPQLPAWLPADQAFFKSFRARSLSLAAQAIFFHDIFQTVGFCSASDLSEVPFPPGRRLRGFAGVVGLGTSCSFRKAIQRFSISSGRSSANIDAPLIGEQDGAEPDGQLLPLVDAIPAIGGKRGRPQRRPDALLGDAGYDSRRHRKELRTRLIKPLIRERGNAHGSGLGKKR